MREAHQIKMNNLSLREAIDQPSLREMRDLLREYKSRSILTLPSECWQQLAFLKGAAVSAGDEVTAKAVWCLETIGRIQDNFISVFLNLRHGEFQVAWNLLERCERDIGFLDDHFTEDEGEFGVEHARAQTKKLQDMYPLTWAFSPAFLHKEIKCSICGTKLTLRSKCDHINGEIYEGEMCSRVVTSTELLHVALVKDPVQKYSFIFPKEDNLQPFSPLTNLAAAIGSPWRRWKYDKEERRQFHPAFKGVGRNEICPCNSGAKYKRCCLGKEKVFPHFKIYLEQWT